MRGNNRSIALQIEFTRGFETIDTALAVERSDVGRPRDGAIADMRVFRGALA
jgi:hypothetical protein